MLTENKKYSTFSEKTKCYQTTNSKYILSVHITTRRVHAVTINDECLRTTIMVRLVSVRGVIESCWLGLKHSFWPPPIAVWHRSYNCSSNIFFLVCMVRIFSHAKSVSVSHGLVNTRDESARCFNGKFPGHTFLRNVFGNMG